MSSELRPVSPSRPSPVTFGALSKSSSLENMASISSPGSSVKRAGHRRANSDVPVDPARALDAASVRSFENRGLYRKGTLSSRSSSTAASPPASASNLSSSSSKSSLATVDKYAYLHSHILSLVQTVSLTESEWLARTQVIQTIQDTVSRYNRDIVAEPFGSFCTGLSLASSDVDIVLTYPSCASDQPRPAAKLHSSCGFTSSESASSSLCSFKFIKSDDDRSSDDNGSLFPLDENEGSSPCSQAADSASQADINWWDIPPPDPDILNVLENQLPVASLEPADCSAAPPPAVPVGAVGMFSFDDIPDVLQACPRCSNIRYIKTAKIPIIKFIVGHDVPNVDPISVDITCALRRSDATSNPVPEHSGVCVREFVKLVLRDYPSIRPVVMVMKVVLSNRGLSNPYRGGLGSYPLFIMVYYWTRFRSQSGESVKFGREGEEGELGRNLMEFLNWTAIMFPWEESILDWEPVRGTRDAVSHFHPKVTPRADLNLPPNLLQPAFTPTVVIMDPLNPGTNVAAVSTS